MYSIYCIHTSTFLQYYIQEGPSPCSAYTRWCKPLFSSVYLSSLLCTSPLLNLSLPLIQSVSSTSLSHCFFAHFLLCVTVWMRDFVILLVCECVNHSGCEQHITHTVVFAREPCPHFLLCMSVWVCFSWVYQQVACISTLSVSAECIGKLNVSARYVL